MIILCTSIEIEVVIPINYHCFYFLLTINETSKRTIMAYIYTREEEHVFTFFYKYITVLV